MKLSPGSTPLPPEVIDSSIQVSSPASMGGTQIVKGSTTNYLTKSPTFQSLNNSIIQLDATFHTLPATGSGNTQADWNTFAATFLQNVCGCGHTAADGQACYRMANLYAQMQGRSSPTGPAVIAGWPLQPIQSIRFFTDTITGIRMCEINMSVCPNGYWNVFNLGRGLLNPIAYLPANPGTPIFPSFGTDWAQIDGLPTTNALPYCSWSDEYMPAGGGTTYYFNEP